MSIIVFEDKTRLFPYIPHRHSQPRTNSASPEHTFIIQQIYHPDFFDYEIYTLSGMNVGMDVFRALKKCNILDSSGYFYNINGLCSDNSDSIINGARDILGVITKYHKFSDDDNSNIEKEAPGEYDYLLPNDDSLREKIFPHRFNIECSPLIPQSSRQNTKHSIHPDLVAKTIKSNQGDHNEGYSFVNKFNSTTYSFSIFNKVPDSELRNKNGVSYVVYRNTEEDTLACFQEDNVEKYQEYIIEIFPELQRLGTIHSRDTSGVGDIIRMNPDKTSVELWNTLQSECNHILPPGINPPRERIKSTIDQLYTLNEEGEGSIAFKTIIKNIVKEIYGDDTKPLPMTMRSIRRTLPIILQSFGLDKKSIMGRVHWCGIKPKIHTPHAKTQMCLRWLNEENISEYK